MASLSPVCVPCKRVMLISKTGRRVLELDAGEPYQVHHGDEFECPACKTRIVAQFGARPIAEHWQTSFAEELEERDRFKRNPYRRYVEASRGIEPLPQDPDGDVL